MNTDTPHSGDLDPAAAALAALADTHRSLSAVIDRELRAACGRLPAADLRKLTQADHHSRPGATRKVDGDETNPITAPEVPGHQCGASRSGSRCPGSAPGRQMLPDGVS